MSLKQNAEDSAVRCFKRLREKHGIRAVPIALLIGEIDLAVGKFGLSKEEWQTVIQELQASYDDHTAFHDQN